MEIQWVWLKRAARSYPNDPALLFRGRKKTFKEVNERVNRISNGLAGLGIKKGDRVAFLEPNSDHFIEIRYALQKRGFVEVPLETRLSAHELKYRILHCEAETLICNHKFVPLVKTISSELGRVKNFISLEGRVEGWISYEKLIETSSPAEPGFWVEGDDLQSIRYTSGTTGQPKAVMRTYRNSMSIAMHLLMETGLNQSDRVLHVLPLTHMTFLYTGPAFKMGAYQVILDQTDPESILGTIEKERITLVNLVPTLVYTLTNYPKIRSFDLTSLRGIHYAGSPIPPPTLRQAISVFGPIFTQYYGLTECAGYCTALRPEEHVSQLSSCGRPNSVIVRVLKEDGTEVQPGEIGEIVLKGGAVTPGFWKNPKMTEERIRNGWLHTGDMAKVDGNGYIYIVDRKDDMIITGGFNVYPKEVEDVIASHPAVGEVAVVGIPDEKWGEAVKAFILLKDGCTVSEREIIQYCSESTASYKKPKSVEFVNHLPKTHTGKIVRRELKKDHLPIS